VGGFLYHSFRDNPLWLILDWGPIAVSSLICCTFYWRTLLPNWFLSLMATLLPLATVIFVLRLLLPRYLFLSLGYPLLAVCVLAPLFISLRNKSRKELTHLYRAVFCVCLAITLRFLDKTQATEFLPMGSHFLWHTMGALTCHFFAAHNYAHPPKSYLLGVLADVEAGEVH
jgi:hemolysin III